jgi:hypothetical protein
MKAAVPILVLLTSLAMSGQEPARGTIAGTVQDVSGSPLPGAAVTAMRPDGTVAGSAVTGANGSFTLSLPPGTYTILAPLPGFLPDIRGIELRSGSRVDLQPFRLRVAPIPERRVRPMPSPFGRDRDQFGPGQEYDITADRQTRQGAIVQYRGNVRMQSSGMEVTADELDFDLMTRTGDARGNVRVRVLPPEFKMIPLTSP